MDWSGLEWIGVDQPIICEIQPAHLTSSRVPMLPDRDEVSLPGPRRAEHHLGARTVISKRMVSPPTAQTIVSAPPNHILTPPPAFSASSSNQGREQIRRWCVRSSPRRT